MRHYFSLSKNAPSVIEANTDLYHHLAKVMRAKAGDRLELVQTDRKVSLMAISSIDANQIKLVKLDEYESAVEMINPVTIVVSPLKNENLELILQKSTELGVHKIIIADFVNSVVTTKRISNKLIRYKKIVQSASEQSQRIYIPEIEFTKLNEIKSSDHNFIANENYAKKDISLFKELSKISSNESITIIFGPEGGFDKNEIEKFENEGFISIGLGPRILRAETSPLYFLSALSVVTEYK